MSTQPEPSRQPAPDPGTSAESAGQHGRALCPGARCFELLGRRRSAYLVWALLDGPRRFTELLAVTDGVSDPMLAKRLRELEEAGIVTRRRFREVPPRVEYSLTDAGEALRPVIEAMERWSRGDSAR